MKSIYPCQGKNPPSRKSIPRKIALPNMLVEPISGGMLQSRTSLQAHLLLAKDKTCNISEMHAQKAIYYAAGKQKP